MASLRRSSASLRFVAGIVMGAPGRLGEGAVTREGVKVVHGGLTVTNRIAGANGLREPGLGPRDGFQRGNAERQEGGDGRRIRAPGAVRVLRVDPFRRKFRESRPVKDDVSRVAGEVTAL